MYSHQSDAVCRVILIIILVGKETYFIKEFINSDRLAPVYRLSLLFVFFNLLNK